MKINQGNSRNIMNCNIFSAATKCPEFWRRLEECQALRNPS